MKIEIDCLVKLQVSFTKLANCEGCKLTVYFFDGERYQHWTELSSKAGIHMDGVPSVTFRITDSYANKHAGWINVFVENEDEHKLLHSFPYHARNKETDYFIFLPREAEEIDQSSFQCWKN